MLILSILIGWSVHAADGSDVHFQGELLGKAPYRVQFVPPPAHHFNMGAPSKVEMSAPSGTKVGAMQKDEHKITVDFAGVAKVEDGCQVQAAFYVCNDANTYCKPVKQNFDCKTMAASK